MTVWICLSLVTQIKEPITLGRLFLTPFYVLCLKLYTRRLFKHVLKVHFNSKDLPSSLISRLKNHLFASHVRFTEKTNNRMFKKVRRERALSKHEKKIFKDEEKMCCPVIDIFKA